MIVKLSLLFFLNEILRVKYQKNSSIEKENIITKYTQKQKCFLPLNKTGHYVLFNFFKKDNLEFVRQLK